MRRERFLLVVETTRPGSVPGEVDFRRFLKSILRSYGLRCVRVERVSNGSLASEAFTVQDEQVDGGEGV